MEGGGSSQDNAGGANRSAQECESEQVTEDTPCCTPSETLDALEKMGYDREEIARMPAAITCGSGGCGNPVAAADIQEGDTVVDLGCGVGLDCFLTAKRVGDAGRVIGVSNSAEHIATGNENKQKMGVDNVEFREGELESMPVDSESVDVAISNCVGIVMKGEGSVLRQVVRVLKPGGRLVTTAGPEIDAKLCAAGLEVAGRTGNVVTARKPSPARAKCSCKE